MSDKTLQPTTHSLAEKFVRRTIGLLGLLACGVAGYLFVLSMTNQGLPAGCGAESGCAEVLNSRWSQVFSIPVSGPAVGVYLGVLVATFFIGPRSPREIRSIAWSILFLLAVVIAASAFWFLGLQFITLHAVCPWCLVEHILGLLIALVVFWNAPITFRRSRKPESAPLLELGIGMTFGLGGGGLILVGGMILAQLYGDYQLPQVSRLPAGENADTGPGSDRLISVLNGDFQLAPHEVPMLGSPDAPKLTVILFDYCCPHCRATHGYLLNGLTRYKDQLGVVLLPMPLNSQCNPYWEQTEARFKHSCELAKLALAVWRVDRTSFQQFDRWLFDPETPRDAQEARIHAEKLVGALELERALEDDWIAQRIELDVEAYHDSKADRIPVIMSPGIDTIVGRPNSETELFELLEKELGLRPLEK